MKRNAKVWNLYKKKHHELYNQKRCVVPSSIWKNYSQLYWRLNAWSDQNSKTVKATMFCQNNVRQLERTCRTFNDQKRTSWTRCFWSIIFHFITAQTFNERIVLLPARYDCTQRPETCRDSLWCMTCLTVNVSNIDRDHAPTRRRNDHRKAVETVSSHVLNKRWTDVQHMMNICWTHVEHLQNKWCFCVHRWLKNLQQTCDREQEVSQRNDRKKITCLNCVLTEKSFRSWKLNTCSTRVEHMMNTRSTRKGKERKGKEKKRNK